MKLVRVLLAALIALSAAIGVQIATSSGADACTGCWYVHED